MFRFFSLDDMLSRRPARPRPLCPRRARRLVVEALEERTLLSYSFTLIADNGPHSSYSAVYNSPMNDQGMVPFRADLRSGGTGIFTRGMDGSLGIIAITSDLVRSFPFGLSITDGGTVCFGADLRDGVRAIFTGSGQELTRLVDTGPDSPFSDLLPPAAGINNLGTVAFRANLKSGGAGLFSVRPGEQPRILYVTGGRFAAFLSPAILEKNGDTATFRATLGTGEEGIFRGSGGAPTTIATTGEVFSAFSLVGSINDAGTVAFRATLSAGGQAVLKGDGGPLTVIADTSGPFSSFFGNDAAINNAGTVAFAANLKTGGSGIFTGPDQVADKVVASGDPLFGSTVASIDATPFPPKGLNDAGQLTFLAHLADGRSALVRADPVHVGTWTAAAAMADPRGFASATLLNDGRVLVAGGFQLLAGVSTVGRAIPGTEIYDPASGTWSPTGSLLTGRAGQGAVRLRDGRVLVAGGQAYNEQGNPFLLNSAEIYDPATGSWSSTGSMHVNRTEPVLTLLDDGRVFISGALRARGPLATSAEIYDPTTGQWTQTADMSTPRSDHVQILLSDGRVLVAGGFSGPTVAVDRYFASAEIYDPKSDTWMPTGSMTMPRADAEGVLLGDGRVLVTGGNAILVPQTRTNTAEIYDPSTAVWTQTFNTMSEPKVDDTITILPDGRVLVAGGITSKDKQVTSADLYDPSTDRWSPAGNLLKARGGHWAVALPDGRVLTGGGLNYDPDTFPQHALASVEIYQLNVRAAPLPGRFGAGKQLATAYPQEGAPGLSIAPRVLVVSSVRADPSARLSSSDALSMQRAHLGMVDCAFAHSGDNLGLGLMDDLCPA